MSKIEDQVKRKIDIRSAIGVTKYDTTMERGDLNIHQWLVHAQEEAMDLAVYLEKIMEVMREDYEEVLLDMAADDHHDLDNPFPDDYDDFLEDYKLPRYTEDEVSERRMRHIGQNGNDGQHYDEANYMYDKTNWNNKAAIQKEQQMHTNNCGNCTVSRTMYPGDIKVTYTHVK